MKIKLKKRKTKNGNEISLYVDGELRLQEFFNTSGSWDTSRSFLIDSIRDELYKYAQS